jgi:glycerol-3-phosphate dehydrogenase (NAD(P)+)
MQSARINNRYLPNYVFPESIFLTAELSEAIQDDCDILIAIPSVGFRDILLKLKPLIKETARLLWVTKGIDTDTGQLLDDVAKEILGTKHAYAVLSGPSFASEVAAGLPTAVVIASENTAFATDLMHRFNSPVFRAYLSTDMIGVEVGGAVKNVLAVATGITDGMKLGANARSALITRGLAEMVRLGLALGGHNETFMGLSGLGDLVLTCTDNQSRNKRFGLALGSGKSTEEAEREIGQVIEGKRNAELVVKLANKMHVEMPIANTVWDILQGKVTLQNAMQQLLTRAPKAE